MLNTGNGLLDLQSCRYYSVFIRFISRKKGAVAELKVTIAAVGTNQKIRINRINQNPNYSKKYSFG
ncbi:MAG TPA: hypothetical protein DEF88_02370 [Porphyromonadaceae bacterium]|nr:hypothetical protein [Porphyromonadaceae bacterium]HCM20446.1 hypothetical protein [Porphyromonadaceae bacterium]